MRVFLFLQKAKEYHMFQKIMALSGFFLSLSCSCYSDYFSFTDSNSGELEPGGSYSYHVHQSVYYFGRKVLSESHSFTFTGALAEDSDPMFRGMIHTWLLYEGKKHYIAIPCVNGEYIYVMAKTGSARPLPGVGKAWKKISKAIFRD
jgi:hypothetical protein